MSISHPKLILIVLFVTIFANSSAKTQFDNSVVGTPKISCEKDRIRVEVQTEKPFNGKIFVKGEYANRHCVRNYEQGRKLTTEETIERERAQAIYANPLPKEFSKFQSNMEKIESLETPDFGNHQTTENADNCKHITNNEIPQDQDELLTIHKGTITKTDLSSSEGENGIEAGKIIGITVSNSDLNGLSNKSETATNWMSQGGASTGRHAAFGIAKNEERLKPATVDLQVLDRSNARNNNGRSKNPTESLLPENCPVQKCEPCDCDSRKRRETVPIAEGRVISHDHGNFIELDVSLGSCNAKRDRTLNPPSLIISFVAIVSFHDSFITKLDRAYHVQCAYTEADKKLTTQLDVSMPPSSDIIGAVDSPTCQYAITSLDGQPIQNSRVGERIRHTWTCTSRTQDMYHMLVHDCFVEDGSGDKFQVIDANGCSMDKYTLSTPTYSPSLMSATVDAYTFKFPDRTNVDFRCSITFCAKEEPQCQEITPPKCDSTSARKKRFIDDATISSSNETMMLHANSLTVFDIDADTESSSFALPQPQQLKSHHLQDSRDSRFSAATNFCVSVLSFGVIVSISTFLTTISAAIIFVYMFIRQKDEMY